MSRSTTNEQSLLEDFAQRVFDDLGVGPMAFEWTGARTMGVLVDADRWQQVSSGLATVQVHAADHGFKVLLRSAPVGP